MSLAGSLRRGSVPTPCARVMCQRAWFPFWFLIHSRVHLPRVPRVQQWSRSSVLTSFASHVTSPSPSRGNRDGRIPRGLIRLYLTLHNFSLDIVWRLETPQDLEGITRVLTPGRIMLASCLCLTPCLWHYETKTPSRFLTFRSWLRLFRAEEARRLSRPSLR